MKTRSFAAHLALGDLYEALVDMADTLAEIHQGKYGIMGTVPSSVDFSGMSALEFIHTLVSWAEDARKCLNPDDTPIVNEWDTLLGTMYRAKYKLENLT